MTAALLVLGRLGVARDRAVIGEWQRCDDGEHRTDDNQTRLLHAGTPNECATITGMGRAMFPRSRYYALNRAGSRRRGVNVREARRVPGQAARAGVRASRARRSRSTARCRSSSAARGSAVSSAVRRQSSAWL